MFLIGLDIRSTALQIYLSLARTLRPVAICWGILVTCRKIKVTSIAVAINAFLICVRFLAHSISLSSLSVQQTNTAFLPISVFGCNSQRTFRIDFVPFAGRLTSIRYRFRPHRLSYTTFSCEGRHHRETICMQFP